MKISIIGGGAAGMLAAIAASKNNENEVLLVEKNEKLGKKLFISGKGRCNVTNACSKNDFFNNIVHNPKFLYSSFSVFSNEDLQKLIIDCGCPLKVERGKRVFPVSDKSSDIIAALKKALKKGNVAVKLNTEVKSILKKEERFVLNTSDGTIETYKLIIATGGLSYPATGSTGDGYRFAKKFDIDVLDREPSLVPLNVKEVADCKEMQGLALKNVGIKVFKSSDEKKIIYKDFGELLFTHFGLSGPVILSASCYIDKKNVEGVVVSIDLKNALDEKTLDDRLVREIEDKKNRNLKSIIATLLPSSMVPVFLDRLSKKMHLDDISDIKANEITKILRKEIIYLLKDFRFTIESKRGFDEAVITRGGVDLSEINPKTMESKKIKGLYFAGEVLDIDALTGGFNIQLAATTGYAAGLNASVNM